MLRKPNQMSFGWWNQGGWDGWDLWHVW